MPEADPPLAEKQIGLNQILEGQKKFFMNKKHWLITYIIATLTLSFYIHIGAKTSSEFLLAGIITSAFFLGIYFCLRHITRDSITIKILKIIGVIIFLALIWASATYASARQFNSYACKDFVGENFFTGKAKIYCNFVPWYVAIGTTNNIFQIPHLIKVPYEAIGIQRIVTGRTYTITWPFNDPKISSSKVTIALTNVSYPHKIQLELFKDIPANRAAQWKVPIDLPPSDRYKLQVISCSYSSTQLPDCANFGSVTLNIFSEGK